MIRMICRGGWRELQQLVYEEKAPAATGQNPDHVGDVEKFLTAGDDQKRMASLRLQYKENIPLRDIPKLISTKQRSNSSVTSAGSCAFALIACSF